MLFVLFVIAVGALGVAAIAWLLGIDVWMYVSYALGRERRALAIFEFKLRMLRALARRLGQLEAWRQGDRYG